MSTNLTTQQSAVVDHVATSKQSLVVEAKAGTGKTTVIIESIIQSTRQNQAVVAFNRAIADEVSAKLKKAGVDWKKCNANTVHSFGFSAYRKAFELRQQDPVDENKVRSIVDTMVGEGKTQEQMSIKAASPVVCHLVSLAKQTLIGFTLPMDDDGPWYDIINHHDLTDDLPETVSIDRLIVWARFALAQSNAQTEVVDYDDMIYLPLLKHCRFWQFEVIFVDEAQDTNSARRALVRAMLRKGGKVVAVGDRNQAIYGFTGADSNALDLIKQDFNAEELPLSKCFRCAKAIVEHAQQWVPGIEWVKPGGTVQHAPCTEVAWADTSGADVVLCRNNKPLVKLAYELLKKGVPCYVEGRDVATSLVKLARKWKITTLAQLEARLAVYQEREVQKALAKKQEQVAQSIEDKVETLQVFIDRTRAQSSNLITDLVLGIEKMFSDTKPGGKADCLTLSSIHKSKGREWNRVFWLDMGGTLPSKYARQDWQLLQEDNLCYVAATRAEEFLVHVSVEEVADD